MSRGRRLRGALLRVAMNRRVAIATGAVLSAPAVVLLVYDYAWESGATDGLALLALATGVALIWNGITGRKADWEDAGA